MFVRLFAVATLAALAAMAARKRARAVRKAYDCGRVIGYGEGLEIGLRSRP